MLSRFDHVQYDDDTKTKQARLKAAAQRVEAALDALADATDEFDNAITAELGPEQDQLPALDSAGNNALDLARDELSKTLGDDTMQHLEQAYMWCGKALRDLQLLRNDAQEDVHE